MPPYCCSRSPHWIRTLAGIEQRIVCAEAVVYASTAGGSLPVQLWIDAPRGTGSQVTAQVTGSGEAIQVSAYEVNFGALDVRASDNILIQLNPPSPGTGALALYDSPEHASSFTYVTVETVESES